MAEWARLASTTIADYMKGVEDKLGTKHKLFALLKKAGNVEYNTTGDQFKWQVEYREVPLEVQTGEGAITPKREDYVKQANLDYISYVLSDAMTKREKLKNAAGPSQLVDYFKTMAKRLERNATRRFTEEFYTDSTATGNAGRLSGIESFMGTSGTVDTTQTGTQVPASRTANAADIVGFPSATYAGLSTILANYGGTWQFPTSAITGAMGIWPSGKGELTTDFFSPTIVCYNNTTFPGTTHTWADQCIISLRYGITHMQRYDQPDEVALGKIFLDRDLYRQFLDKQDSKEHAYVQSSYSLRAMGFEDVIQQDGTEVTWEWGIPAGIGYGFSVANMTLRSMQDSVWEVSPVEFQRLNNAYTVVADFYGQLKFHSPRKFMKLITIAS